MNKIRYAFTLIELLIVIAIIIIMTGVAIPLSAGYVSERQVYNTATQLQQDLLLIQNKAITYSSDKTQFKMRLYLGNNAFAFQSAYNAPALGTTVPSASSSISVRKFPSSIGFPAYFGITSTESVMVGTTKVTSGYVDIVFDYQGLPYWSINGGSLQQTSGYIILTNSTQSKVIKVNISPIGSVTIEWVKK